MQNFCHLVIKSQEKLNVQCKNFHFSSSQNPNWTIYLVLQSYDNLNRLLAMAMYTPRQFSYPRDQVYSDACISMLT